MAAWRKGAGAALLVLLAGCNHWFYQPDGKAYTTRKQLEPVVISESFITEPESGNRLHLWRLAADHSPPFATVVHFHGNSQNLTSHVIYSYWLTYYGFEVVTFDYSGYGRSTGTPSRRQTIADGAAFLAHTLGAKRPVIVLGQSLGGAVALSALAKLREQTGSAGARAGAGERAGAGNEPAGLVIDSSFSSYRQVARKMLGRQWLTWALQYPLALTISEEDNPIAAAGQVRVPVLMVHSEDDPVVAYSEGRELFAALGSEDKSFVTLTGEHHTDAFHFGPKPHKRKLVEFLCRLSQEREDCLHWLEEVNTTCTEAAIRHCQIDPKSEAAGPD